MPRSKKTPETILAETIARDAIVLATSVVLLCRMHGLCRVINSKAGTHTLACGCKRV